MTDQDPRTDEIRRQAYASAHELLSAYPAQRDLRDTDELASLLVLAWLNGYQAHGEWTRAELAAAEVKMAAAIAGLNL